MTVKWKKWTEMPFSLEKTVQEYLQRNLVTGLTSGDSNEWYYGEINEIATTIEKLLT